MYKPSFRNVVSGLARHSGSVSTYAQAFNSKVDALEKYGYYSILVSGYLDFAKRHHLEQRRLVRNTKGHISCVHTPKDFQLAHWTSQHFNSLVKQIIIR